ncbi:Importin alpha re-exporter [Entamoeba marina]
MDQFNQLHQFILNITNKINQVVNLKDETDMYMSQIQKPEFTPLLLQLLLQQSIDSLPVKQTAAIFLRQILMKYYKEEDYYPDNVRQQVRDSLFQSIFVAPIATHRLLLGCFSIVADADFPKRWPNLIDLIIQSFQNANPEQQLLCIKILSAISKKYRIIEVTNETVYEIKEVVKVLPVIIPVFLQLAPNDPMVYPFLKFLRGVIQIELVDDIENRIELLCQKFDEIIRSTTTSNKQLQILKIYRKFCSNYLDNQYLNDVMTKVIYQTTVQILSSPMRETSLVIAGYDVLKTIPQILSTLPNDQFLSLINLIAKDISLTEEEVNQIKEDPTDFVKTEIEGELVSIRKVSGDVLNSFKRCREDTTNIVFQGITSLIKSSNFDPAIRLFIGLIVEGETPTLGATRLANGIQLIDFWNSTVKNLFFTSPQLITVKFVNLFRSVLTVTPPEFDQIFMKLVEIALLETTDPSLIVCSLLAADAIEKMLILKTTPRLQRSNNCVSDELCSKGYSFSEAFLIKGTKIKSIYHLRAAVRFLQRISKLNIPVDASFTNIIQFLLQQASIESTNRAVDGTFVGMKFEAFSVALSVHRPTIEENLINTTSLALNNDNIDVLSYLLQILTLLSLASPMVKFIAACLKISPTIFSQELISKIMQLLQFLINIDYVDDAFYLLNAYTFSLSSENLRNIPDIIQMICNRLAEHRTRRLTDNIVKYILQLCYVMDIQTIPTLRIPQGFATLVISNMQKLPTDMNRTTFFNFEFEELKEDRSTNLSTIKRLDVDPVVSDMKIVQNHIKLFFTTPLIININNTQQQVVMTQFLDQQYTQFLNEIIQLQM